MSLRYHDEKYFEEYHQHDNVEGLDFPYLCQICNHFLSKKAVNWCGDADYIMIGEKGYEWLCEKCAGITEFGGSN